MKSKPHGHGRASDALIAVSDLSAEFPHRGASAATPVLGGVSFTLAPGEVLGVLGDAGSGKSALLRLLSARDIDTGGPLPKITGGEATVLGHRLKRLGRRARARVTFGVGYLPQQAAVTLPPEYTVREIIASPVTERDPRFNSKAIATRVASLLDAVHLPLSMLDSYPYELSGGQRQRVALARSLMLGPSLLLADMPTGGLDPLARDTVIDVLRELRAKSGFAAVIVSHEVKLLRAVTDTVIVLRSGRVVGAGHVNDVLAAVDEPYIAELSRALTLMGGEDAESADRDENTRRPRDD